jgi:hypothetical protein
MLPCRFSAAPLVGCSEEGFCGWAYLRLTTTVRHHGLTRGTLHNSRDIQLMTNATPSPRPREEVEVVVASLAHKRRDDAGRRSSIGKVSPRPIRSPALDEPRRASAHAARPLALRAHRDAVATASLDGEQGLIRECEEGLEFARVVGVGGDAETGG